jgi:hypothetical protein
MGFMKLLRNAAWIRLGLLFILAVWLGLQLAPDAIYSDQTFDQVSAAVLAKTDQTLYPAQSSQKLRRYFQLDPAQFEQAGFWRLDDAMSAQELLIVQSDDAAALDAFEQAAQNRIDTQTNIYEGYAPDQAAMMKDAIIVKEGNYALYYTGTESQTIKTAFQSALKGAAA